MPLQLPPVANAQLSEKDLELFEIRCAKEVKKAKGSLATLCALPPTPILLSLATADAKSSRRRYASTLEQASNAEFPTRYSVGGSSGSRLVHSSSAPQVSFPNALEYDAKEVKRLAHFREQCRQHVAFSPQGLFAYGEPGLVGSSVSGTLGRFWDSVQSREEDLKRRAAKQKSAASIYDAGCSLGAATSNPAEAAANSKMSAQKNGSKLPAPSELGSSLLAKNAEMQYKKQYSACMFDIHDGIRVLIFRTAPAPLGTVKTWPPKGGGPKIGSKEDAMLVYQAYCGILAMYENSSQAMRAAEEDEDAMGGATPRTTLSASMARGHVSEGSRPQTGSEYHERVGAALSAENLEPISWSNMTMWIEQTQSSSEDRRLKTLCDILMKQLTFWQGSEAGVEEKRNGVYLHTLMKWIWPAITPVGLAKIHVWICLEEIAKINQPTPPNISNEERRSIEELFNVLDSGKHFKKGYLTAVDLAGGEDLPMAEQLKNVIDVDTVKTVYGEDCKVEIAQFMEMMCSDNHRGYPQATRVTCEGGLTGKTMMKVTREVVNYEGWWFKDVPAEEVSSRQRIEALELEIVRWRTVAIRGGRNVH